MNTITSPKKQDITNKHKTNHKSQNKHRQNAKQKQATLIASHGSAAVAVALTYTFTHWHFQCLTHISMYTVSCSGRSAARNRYGAACCRSVRIPAAKIWPPLAGRAAAGWPCRWAPLAGCEIWHASKPNPLPQAVSAGGVGSGAWDSHAPATQQPSHC